MRPTNPRWRAAAILKKIEKLSYLLIRLTDFDEMWHSNAFGPYAPDMALKF